MFKPFTMQRVLVFLSVFALVVPRGLKEEFSWTRLNYDWPDGKTPTDENFYSYKNNIPIGNNLWKNKLFITVPRLDVGVPSTVNYVWLNKTKRHNVPLIPYPDWKINSLEGREDGNRFVSVYRVIIDPCDRLWLVDEGRIETPGNDQKIQPRTIYIIDLKTDKIIHRHVLNSSLIKESTNLVGLTVDLPNDQCDDAFAYLPDVGGYDLIVYSLKSDTAWSMSHTYFFLEPLAGDFFIGGYNFTWIDGISSIGLTDVKSDGHRDAYFHSMTGFNQYRVSTRILKNRTLATRSYHGTDLEYLGNRSTQCGFSDLYQPYGIIFLPLPNKNALGCWNIETPLDDLSIVHHDDKKMIYVGDVKISGDKIVVLTNELPIYYFGTLNYNKTNFRVWIQSVDQAIKGTKCEKPKRS